jgi:Mrp family chromosome partitioning ATPase
LALSFVSAFWRKALRFVLEGCFVAIWISSLAVLSAVGLERHQAQVALTLSAAASTSSSPDAISRLRDATAPGAWWREQHAAFRSSYSAKIVGDGLLLTCTASTPRAAMLKCNKAARDNLDHGPAIAVSSVTRIVTMAPLPVDQFVLIGLAFGLAWLVLRAWRAQSALVASRSGLLGMDDAQIERRLVPLSAASFEPAQPVVSRVFLPPARLAASAAAPSTRRVAPFAALPFERPRLIVAAPTFGGETYALRLAAPAPRAVAQSSQLAVAQSSQLAVAQSSQLAVAQSSQLAVARSEPVVSSRSQLALAVVASPETLPTELRESSQVVRIERPLTSQMVVAPEAQPAPAHTQRTSTRRRQDVQVIARIMPLSAAPTARPVSLAAARTLPAQPKPRLLVPPPAAVVVPESLLYTGVSPVSTIGRLTLAQSKANVVIERALPGDGSPRLAAFAEGTLEALRAVRDRLFRQAQAGCCVVRVCADPESEDAKSQVAAKLAWLVAQPQVARALLLEVDFTSPAVDRVLNLEVPAELGFTRQLQRRNEAPGAAISVMRIAPMLHVLAEGSDRLPRMLETAHFSSALGQQRRQYDVIVADGPVAGSWLDTRGLDGVVDHVVFVTAARTPQARVDRLVKQTFVGRVEVTVVRVNEQGPL